MARVEPLPSEWAEAVRLMRLRAVAVRPTSVGQAVKMLDAGECIFCPNNGYRHVGIHIAKAHGVSAAEVRDLCLLPRAHPLCSADVSRLRRELDERPDAIAEFERARALRDPHASVTLTAARRSAVQQLNAAKRAAETCPLGHDYALSGVVESNGRRRCMVCRRESERPRQAVRKEGRKALRDSGAVRWGGARA